MLSTVSAGVTPATCTLPGHSIRQKVLTLRVDQGAGATRWIQMSAEPMARVGASGTDQCQGNLWSNDLSDSWICGDS